MGDGLNLLPEEPERVGCSLQSTLPHSYYGIHDFKYPPQLLLLFFIKLDVIIYSIISSPHFFPYESERERVSTIKTILSSQVKKADAEVLL